MHVAFLGWYGHSNFGDDEIVLGGLKQLFKDSDISVFSDSPKASYPLIDFDEVNKCDLFVLGGGELINSGRLFINSLSWGRCWSSKIKIPKVILGCGVNVTHASELKPNVIKELSNFDYIGVRDNTASNILQSIPKIASKVNLFYDAAFGLEIEPSTPHARQNTAIVIPTDRTSNIADEGIRKYNIAVESQIWLKIRLLPYDKAMFLPFGKTDNDDFKTCQTLSGCSNNSVILNSCDLSLQKVLDLISGSSMVFPYRLHGLILSFILGTKYEFYPYHWKLQRVHETLVGCNPAMIRHKQKEMLEKILGL